MAYRVKKLYPSKGILRSDLAKNALTGVVYFALCIAISFLGLRTIISKGYSMLGYLAIPLIVIPLCILMPIRYYKHRHMEKGETESHETV